jgi:small GTP-binding protein
MDPNEKKDTSDYDYTMKVIIIGDSGVGKSSLLYRYSKNKFVDNYMMTIGINYVWATTEVDDLKIKLQIWDTAGQEKYKTITQNYYQNSNGAIISFSINSKDSFESVSTYQALHRKLD